MNISEFRKQHPEYQDIPDIDLTRKLHNKFYSDIPINDFAKKFGVSLVSRPTAEISHPEKYQPGVVDKFRKFTSPLAYALETAHVTPSPEQRKPILTSVKHGLSRMGIPMVKGLAGAAKAEYEFGGAIRKRFWDTLGLQQPKYQQKMDQFLKDWSAETANAIDWYYENHPEESSQHPPGFKATLAAHVAQPEVLIQGVLESIPLVLQGTIGTVVGGPPGGILAMTPMLSGDVYVDARKEGTKPLPALGQALATGLGQAAIEEWTLGRKFGLAKNFRKMVGKGLPKILWEGTKTFFRGMAEEGSQEFIDNFWNWVFTDREQSWTENIGTAMAAGGPLELAMGGAFAATAYVGKSIPTKEKIHRIERIRQAVEQNPQLNEQQKQEINQELDKQERYVGDIEFTMQKEVTERFPDIVNNQETLEQIGNQITKHLGIEEKINWQWSKKKTKRLLGKFRKSDNTLTIFGPRHQSYANPSAEIKETIVHELGHLVKPSYIPETTKFPAKGRILKDTRVGGFEIIVGEQRWHFGSANTEAEAKQMWLDWQNKFGKRKIHHPEFKKWVAENRRELYEEQKTVAPIHRREAIGPIEEREPGVYSPEMQELKKEATAEEKPKPKHGITKRKALTLGHTLPDAFGWSEEQRRDFMESATGKRSMENMSLEEMRFYVDALKVELGIGPDEEVETPIEELITDLQRKKVTEELPHRKITKTKMYQLKHACKKGLVTFGYGLARMERFFDSLGKSFVDNIWLPVKEARGLAAEQENRRATEFLSYLENQNIDTAIWVGKTQNIPKTNLALTAAQRIGTYILNKNKHGKRYLRKGKKFTDADIKAIEEFMSPEEIKTGEWLLQQYESQADILFQAAIQAGIDPAELKREFNYSPLLRTDIELERQENFLTPLIDPFRQESYSPEKGPLEKRKEHAFGDIELDALVCYLHNIHRVEQFIAMAPTAKRIQGILNNRKFKEELNRRTYKQGSKLINSWMADTVRGYSTSNATQVAKIISIIRHNAIVYAIGWNVPSFLRQILSGSNAIAVDPLMLKYMPLNTKEATQNYEALRDFVYERSPDVKYRNYDRDLRRKYRKSDLIKLLKKKNPWSSRATRWIRWMDKHTTVVAWKSLFDVGMEKFNGNEKEAIKFANKYVGRTQPMANVEDLPQFFRGGAIEKLLTTFQNQINNNGNFYVHDIIQATKKGEINLRMAAYRTMFSYILPAILYGMIGRARPPTTWKELGVDLATYPVAPLFIVGRWIDRIIRGWGHSGTVIEIGGEAVVGFGRAALKGDTKKAIKNAVVAIGAFSGRPTAQMIRTTEGAMDLAAGTTKDPRRLIYSEWALEQGKKKKKRVSIF